MEQTHRFNLKQPHAIYIWVVELNPEIDIGDFNYLETNNSLLTSLSYESQLRLEIHTY